MIGLAGWGLRPSELCALRADQVNFGQEDEKYPHLVFQEGERKNGPGTVSLLIGIENLTARTDTLADDPD